MKKASILILVLTLTLLVATDAAAAVHNSSGAFKSRFILGNYFVSGAPEFEGWYDIEKETHAAMAGWTSAKYGNALETEYYLNDQTFINFSNLDIDEIDSITNLKGSYLFDNGFFVGIDYSTFTIDVPYLYLSEDITQSVISPGFRLNLDSDKGYVAFSMDWAANDDAYLDNGVIDYEMNFRYYTKNSRICGQLIMPNEDVIPDDEDISNDEMYGFIGAAYRYSNIIFGANLWIHDVWAKADLGCSTNFKNLGLEFKYEEDDGDINLYYNILYSFNDSIRAGLQVDNLESADDLKWTTKVKCNLDRQNELTFMHQLDYDDYESVTYLRWDIKF